MNAVDTNVLVYAVDVDEPHKQSQALDLLQNLNEQDEDFVLPWQVAAEFLACPRRSENQGRITRDETSVYLRDFVESTPIVFPTISVLQASLDLSNHYCLSHWDSMLLPACIEAGVDTLYSENMDAATQYDSLRIVNPFIA